MASEVDWNSSFSTEPGNKKGSSDKFIKFSAGTKKTLRPIGSPVRFIKFFVNGRSLVVDPEYKESAAAKLSAHFGEEVKPQLRYAINVIDRDDGQIRILEQGHSVFENFANWSFANDNRQPGGSVAMDWVIKAQGDGLQRRYSVTPVKETRLTEEEIHRIRDLREHHSLKEVFKGCSINEIIDVATGDQSNSGPEPSRPRTTSQPVAASAAVTVPAADDPMSW